LRGVIAIAAGGNHSLALDAEGNVTGWGRNTSGQVTAPMFRVPVTAIAAGGDYSLALLADGTVTAWGTNYNGQLSVPSGLQNVRAIAAGWSHAIALLNDGTVVCWGNNRAGQCTVPADLKNVVAVTAGDSHTVALRSDGSVASASGSALAAPPPPIALPASGAAITGGRGGGAAGTRSLSGGFVAASFNPRQRRLVAAGDSDGVVRVFKLGWRMAAPQPSEEALLRRFVDSAVHEAGAEGGSGSADRDSGSTDVGGGDKHAPAAQDEIAVNSITGFLRSVAGRGDGASAADVL
jgi:hypothetical protein